MRALIESLVEASGPKFDVIDEWGQIYAEEVPESKIRRLIKKFGVKLKKSGDSYQFKWEGSNSRKMNNFVAALEGKGGALKSKKRGNMFQRGKGDWRKKKTEWGYKVRKMKSDARAGARNRAERELSAAIKKIGKDNHGWGKDFEATSSEVSIEDAVADFAGGLMTRKLEKLAKTAGVTRMELIDWMADVLYDVAKK